MILENLPEIKIFEIIYQKGTWYFWMANSKIYSDKFIRL